MLSTDYYSSLKGQSISQKPPLSILDSFQLTRPSKLLSHAIDVSFSGYCISTELGSMDPLCLLSETTMITRITLDLPFVSSSLFLVIPAFGCQKETTGRKLWK